MWSHARPPQRGFEGDGQGRWDFCAREEWGIGRVPHNHGSSLDAQVWQKIKENFHKNWKYRKVLANTSPTIEIVREGDQWNMTFKVDSFSAFCLELTWTKLKSLKQVSLKTNKIIFKIGEEFQENSPVDQTPQQVGPRVQNNCWTFFVFRSHLNFVILIFSVLPRLRTTA